MKKQTALEIVSVLALVLGAVAYRVILGEFGGSSGWLPNFSPMAALVFCGAIFLPWRAGLLLPAAVLLVSDVILNRHFGSPLFDSSMLVRYVALGALAGAGLWLRFNPKPAPILAGSLAGSLLFYVTTNTASWLALDGYSKNFAGWVQALTTGLPGYQPQTWVFFRNSVVSDLLFTMLILLCVSAARENAREDRMLAAS